MIICFIILFLKQILQLVSHLVLVVVRQTLCQLWGLGEAPHFWLTVHYWTFQQTPAGRLAIYTISHSQANVLEIRKSFPDV